MTAPAIMAVPKSADPYDVVVARLNAALARDPVFARKMSLALRPLVEACIEENREAERLAKEARAAQRREKAHRSGDD
jgi:hypothetical protein